MAVWTPPRRRCAFLHIPKTAGMTLRAMLRCQYEMARAMPAERWSDLSAIPRRLPDYDLFVGHFRYPFADIVPRDTFVFTFLRDPAERTVSHLRHILADPSFDEYHEALQGRDPRALLEDPKIRFRCCNVQVGYMTRRHRGPVRVAVAPSADDVTDDDVPAAIENLRRLDHVGFVDSFDEDLARLFAALGLHPPAPAQPQNDASVRPDHLSGMEGELLEMARSYNGPDYALYEAAQAHRDRTPPPSLDRAMAALIADGAYPTISGPVEFPLDGPIPGQGFWPAENGDGAPYRWTGPRECLTLHLPLAPRPFTIEIDVYMPEAVGPLTATIDGAAVPFEIVAHDDRASTLRIAIAPDAARAFRTVAVRSERTHPASRDDPRHVGYIVGGLRLL